MKTYFGILVYAGKGPKDLMEKRAETVGGDFTPPFLPLWILGEKRKIGVVLPDRHRPFLPDIDPSTALVWCLPNKAILERLFE